MRIFRPKIRIVTFPFPSGWTWNRSAFWRRNWLLFAWAIVFLQGALGPVASLLALVRLAGSMLQLSWNIQLGRVQPLSPHDRTDWLLVLATIAGAAIYGAASSGVATAPPWSVAVAGSAMLLPYSAVQLRMVNRSRRAQVVAQLHRLVSARPVAAPYLLARSRASASSPVIAKRAA